jgi:hypothetical protein
MQICHDSQVISMTEMTVPIPDVSIRFFLPTPLDHLVIISPRKRRPRCKPGTVSDLAMPGEGASRFRQGVNISAKLETTTTAIAISLKRGYPYEENLSRIGEVTWWNYVMRKSPPFLPVTVRE